MTMSEIEARRRAFAESLRERVLPLRRQAEVRNDWLRERLDTLLPELMARQGVDMWLVECREYNEDPVTMTLLPEPQMTARRRTILVFNSRPDGSVERVSLCRTPYEGFYTDAWDYRGDEPQEAALARVVAERNPRAIGIDVGEHFAFGDGLSHHEFEWLSRAVGERYADRFQPVEQLCVGWLERRIPAELAVYPSLAKLAHDLIAEVFSRNAIEPGVTTTDDLVWWLRQTIQDAGLRAWFSPTIDIQTKGEPSDMEHRGGRRTLIQPGDLLHCDVGFAYLGLCTDHQQNAYVLKPGESDAREGLKAALAAGNRLQDIHLAQMAPGRTGNDVLRATLAQATEEGITGRVYSHPIGYHGHAAGPVIGLVEQQQGVPDRGDYPIYDDTCYSIELNARHPVPEWGGQLVTMALEEDAMLSGGRMTWLDGRQEWLHVI